MDLRRDKCCTFGMEKKNGSFEQFQPVLWVYSRPIPPVEIMHEFCYLGKLFSFDMNNRLAKEQMENK